MTGAGCILAIDQGTTSTRAILFDADGQPLASAQRDLPQVYPRDGWMEQDPEDIWRTTVEVCRAALSQRNRGADEVLAIGIANQRETTLVWERSSGRPIYNAIVWQDRRTADACQSLKASGNENLIHHRTGLTIDPYFSGTKIAWILNNVAGARSAADRGALAFGTVDSYLLWRLSGGTVHATDATNAARTMLFNIHTLDWDPDLLHLLEIPAELMPPVHDNTHDFGATEPDLFGRSLPITGMAGDQQAAVIGQACFEPGMIKSTYGTDCFVLLNTGDRPVPSRARLLTTPAYRIDGKTCYALEGSIFTAGASLQWLRDSLKVIGSASESAELSAGLDHNHGVYFVPAFTGLGAPHWDPLARGAILGLSRDTGIAEIVRAALESVCYQTRDVVRAMVRDGGIPPSTLRVDGGMAANDWLLRFLADLLDVTVERPAVIETTALGAAYLAGLQAGLFRSLDDIRAQWRPATRFHADLAARDRADLVRGWEKALARVLETGAAPG